jgi:hypothetical protein
MSRTRSVASSALGVNRRTVLAATAAVSVSAGVGYALRPTDSQAATATADGANAAAEAPVAHSRVAPAAPLAPYTKGTTLATVAAPRTHSGYRRLGDGAGWKRVVRGDLANAKSGRAGRRTALASFVQFTDLHLMDSQHPLRLEYLRSTDKHAWRPHEALTVQGGISLVERVNALRGAPVTGSRTAASSCTGSPNPPCATATSRSASRTSRASWPPRSARSAAPASTCPGTRRSATTTRCRSAASAPTRTRTSPNWPSAARS